MVEVEMTAATGVRDIGPYVLLSWETDDPLSEADAAQAVQFVSYLGRLIAISVTASAAAIAGNARHHLDPSAEHLGPTGLLAPPLVVPPSLMAIKAMKYGSPLAMILECGLPAAGAVLVALSRRGPKIVRRYGRLRADMAADRIESEARGAVAKRVVSVTELEQIKIEIETILLERVREKLLEDVPDDLVIDRIATFLADLRVAMRDVQAPVAMPPLVSLEMGSEKEITDEFDKLDTET